MAPAAAPLKSVVLRAAAAATTRTWQRVDRLLGKASVFAPQPERSSAAVNRDQQSFKAMPSFLLRRLNGIGRAFVPWNASSQLATGRLGRHAKPETRSPSVQLHARCGSAGR